MYTIKKVFIKLLRHTQTLLQSSNRKYFKQVLIGIAKKIYVSIDDLCNKNIILFKIGLMVLNEISTYYTIVEVTTSSPLQNKDKKAQSSILFTIYFISVIVSKQ